MRRPRNAATASKKLDIERLSKLKAESKTIKEKGSKKKSGAPKDSAAPKRPAGPFFVFMEAFRKSFKENFPDNKSLSAVGKAGGEKWKSMSDTEKAPYMEKAQKRKEEYEKSVKEYKTMKSNTDKDDEKSVGSEISTSEVSGDAEQEASS